MNASATNVDLLRRFSLLAVREAQDGMSVFARRMRVVRHASQGTRFLEISRRTVKDNEG